MSLINQMLKDLEERSAPQLDEHQDTIKGVAWTASSKSYNKRHLVSAITIASILCTGMAAAGYYHFSGNAEKQTEILSENNKELHSFNQTNDEVSPVGKSVSTQEFIEHDVAQENIDSLKASEIHEQEEMQARKMLAALMATGTLTAKQDILVEPKEKELPPMRLAVVDTSEKKSTVVQKKLRPLDKNKRAEISYQQGYELIARGQQNAAEHKLLHAIELVASHIKARETLAVLYLQQQRITDAAEILKRGMSLSPKYMPYREIYARTFMANNQLADAISMLNNEPPALNQNPGYYALLAGLYQKNQQHDAAAATYLKLIKRNPKQSQWWLGMAISLEKLEKKKEAKSAFLKARELKLPVKLQRFVDSRLRKMDVHDNAK